MDVSKLIHRQTMTEEAEFINSLPKHDPRALSISQLYKGLERDIEEFGNEDNKAEEARLIKRSISLSDKILDYAEEGLPDDDETINRKNKEQMEKEKKEKFDATLAKAIEAQSKKDWTNAKALYSEAMTLDPEDKACPAALAEIETAIKAEADAATEAETKKNKEAAEKNYQTLITSADEAFKAGKLDDAASAYKEAGKIFPDEKYPKEQIEAITKAKAAVGGGSGAGGAGGAKISKRNVVEDALEDIGLDL